MRLEMTRKRSVPHTFEGNLAAEKARLEAQLATLKQVPRWTRFGRK